MKVERRKNKKEIIAVIIAIIVAVIMLIILINALTREKFELTNWQKQDLANIFPQEHIDKIYFYKGGLFSIGSTKTLCNSIYIDEDYKINDSGLLVHEVMHTWQARKGCLTKEIIPSLYAQFSSYLTEGSRNYAYYYSINESIENLNPEQEASIVEDFYKTSLANRSEFNNFYTLCRECNDSNLTSYEINKIADNAREIFEKYL